MASQPKPPQLPPPEDTESFKVDFEKEQDGRWLAEVMEIPGALAYGQTRDEAVAKVKALAFRVLADRLEHGESSAELMSVSFIAA